MRALAILGLAALASCSGDGGEEQKQAEAPAAAPASALEPGQWEVTMEVTDSRRGAQSSVLITGNEKPMPTIPPKSTTSLCVGQEQAQEPPPGLLAVGRDGCKYSNFYMSRGRMVASLSCPQPDGQMSMSVDGEYAADSFQATGDTTIGIYGTGSLIIKSKLTGRRTGACEAAAKA
jgi:Protein of unknown function (DUF3617)